MMLTVAAAMCRATVTKYHRANLYGVVTRNRALLLRTLFLMDGFNLNSSESGSSVFAHKAPYLLCITQCADRQ